MSDLLYIFNFHRISNEFSPAYPPIPIKVFEKIIKYLNKKYLIIPQSELLSKLSFLSKKDLAILSFDDAYSDFYECALPVLDKYKLPAVQHVITNSATNGTSFWTQKLNKIIEEYYKNHIPINIPEINFDEEITSVKNIEKIALNIYLRLLGNPDKLNIVEDLGNAVNDKVQYTKMMSWENLIEAYKYRVEIGSHTCSHENLKTLNKNEIYTELKDSYDIIKKKIGESPLSIAYPNGQYNHDINEISLEVGYKLLYTADESSNNIKNMVNKGLYHRYNIYHTSYIKNLVRLNFMVK